MEEPAPAHTGMVSEHSGQFSTVLPSVLWEEAGAAGRRQEDVGQHHVLLNLLGLPSPSPFL